MHPVIPFSACEHCNLVSKLPQKTTMKSASMRLSLLNHFYCRWVIPVVAMVLLLNSGKLSANQPPRPNVIHILADDLGFGSVGFTGQELIATPNIDQLAEGGMKLNNSYAATVCAPTRAMLLTGFHQSHTFVNRNGRISAGFRAEEVMVGTVANQAGYNTAIYGKWGFGATGQRTVGFGSDPMPSITNVNSLPTSHGFTSFAGMLNHSAAHDFFYDWIWVSDSSAPEGVSLIQNNTGPGGLPEYMDDVTARNAESFVAQQSGAQEPFYLQLNFQAPHWDIDAIAEVPDGWGQYSSMPWTDKQKSYAAMITRMDSQIGALVETLRDPNGDGDTSDSMLENTLIIFTSDNGPTPEDGSPINFFNASGPFRGGKRDLYEGGLHVPTFAYWEGTIAPGTETDLRTDVADLMPTIAELSGGRTPVGIDGVSILPTLIGQGEQRIREHLIFEHHEGSGPANTPSPARWTIIRQDGMKLISFANGSFELFDLNVDPGEVSPLDVNEPVYAETFAALHSSAMDEQVQSSQYVEYRQWTGPHEGVLSQEGNWSGPGTPDRFWSATVANNEATDRTAIVNSNVETIGVEVRGASAEQALEVQAGYRLSGRNEVRISEGGRMELAGGELVSNRWIDILPSGQLSGHGAIQGALYNAGMLSPGRDSNLPEPPPLPPPAPLPPKDLNTGVEPAVIFDFEGIQDDSPLTQTSALSDYVDLNQGLIFGPGVMPRGAADAGDEFNVQGHTIGGTLQDAIDEENYLSFSVSPARGVSVIPQSASFNLWRNGANAARNWAILSSVDGFTVDQVLSEIFINDAGIDNQHLLTADFTSSGAINQPIEVRLYGWNASGANGNTHVNAAAMLAQFVAGPTFSFDMSDVQDTWPVNELAVDDPNLTLVEGFSPGSGLAPRHPAGGGTNAGSEFNLSGFQPGGSLADAIAQQDYVGFTVAPALGLGMLVESASFSLWRNGTDAPTEYAILTSDSGFSPGSAVAQASILVSGPESEQDVTAVFEHPSILTEPVEFRLYGWGADNIWGNTHFTGASLRVSYVNVDQLEFGSAGILSLKGNYTQLPQGTLAIEIGGLDNSDIFRSQYDQLIVSGEARLDGKISITLLDGYEPALGDSINFLLADIISGEFSEVVGTISEALKFDLVYHDDRVEAVVVPALPGDFNLDGSVDGKDFLQWQRELGTLFDMEELAAWSQNFGTIVTSGSSTAGAIIPEPGSICLLVTSSMAFSFLRSLR